MSASGIARPDEAVRLLDAGYAGLLIGTGLLRAGDLGEWFDGLRDRRATHENASGGRSVLRRE